MSTSMNGLAGKLPLLLQEGKEAVQGVQDVIDRRGDEPVVVSCVELRIDIHSGGVREVPIDSGLAGGR
jgi:hypothetical protein